MAGREVVNRQVNIYIQSGEAQKAYDSLIKKEKQLNEVQLFSLPENRFFLLGKFRGRRPRNFPQRKRKSILIILKKKKKMKKMNFVHLFHLLFLLLLLLSLIAVKNLLSTVKR